MTEENLVYQLLSEIRGAQLNNDEVIDEREVRVFLREHRPSIIESNFQKGLTVFGIEFQPLGLVDLTNQGYALTKDLPSIIRLPNNAGIKVTTPTGYNIPVISKESYILSLSNPMNQFQPKAYIENNILYVYEGKSNVNAMNDGGNLSGIVTEIKTGLKVYVEAILDNPEDGVNYNWTSSVYPLSHELINKLKTNLKRNNFNLILNTKSDEAANMKNDNVLYHEQLRQNN